VRAAGVPHEVERLRGRRERAGENGDKNSVTGKAIMLRSEKKGVSVEGEFAFAKAVGEFWKEEVRAGSVKDNYVLNLEEQLRMRCLKEGDGDKRLRVLYVGASQMGRLVVELNRTHGEKVNMIGFVQMGSKHTEQKIMGVINEMEKGNMGRIW
jgi:hypothetical protein